MATTVYRDPLTRTSLILPSPCAPISIEARIDPVIHQPVYGCIGAQWSESIKYYKSGESSLRDASWGTGLNCHPVAAGGAT